MLWRRDFFETISPRLMCAGWTPVLANVATIFRQLNYSELGSARVRCTNTCKNLCKTVLITHELESALLYICVSEAQAPGHIQFLAQFPIQRAFVLVHKLRQKFFQGFSSPRAVCRVCTRVCTFSAFKKEKCMPHVRPLSHARSY